jgi:polyisoprenoid-binding protein YceI
MRAIWITLLSAAGLLAETYTIQPEAGSRFGLEVHKTGLMAGKVHVFEFERYAGRLEFDAVRPEAARMELTVAAASIVCQDTWVDAKDKKKVLDVALDMMQHANHPELKFASTAVVRRGEAFDVTGNLTIKGIPKPITVSVTMKPSGAGWVFTGKAVILRKDYKINPPSPVPFGIIGNKEEMPVSFTLTARK